MSTELRALIARHLHRARHRRRARAARIALAPGRRRLAPPALRPRHPRRRRRAAALRTPASSRPASSACAARRRSTADGQAHTLRPLRRALRAARRQRARSRPAPTAATSPRSPRRSTRAHPVQVVRFAEVRQDPTLHFDAGGPTAKRDLNVLIGKNVEAGRIMAGVTFSEPGNWTSWPPHEHAAHARRGLPLHRHAGAGVRRAAGLHRTRASPSWRPSSARATSC